MHRGNLHEVVQNAKNVRSSGVAHSTEAIGRNSRTSDRRVPVMDSVTGV